MKQKHRLVFERLLVLDVDRVKHVLDEHVRCHRQQNGVLEKNNQKQENYGYSAVVR